MTTVTEVGNAFSDELREKNCGHLNHPGLPPDLQEAVGELITSL